MKNILLLLLFVSVVFVSFTWQEKDLVTSPTLPFDLSVTYQGQDYAIHSEESLDAFVLAIAENASAWVTEAALVEAEDEAGTYYTILGRFTNGTTVSSVSIPLIEGDRSIKEGMPSFAVDCMMRCEVSAPAKGCIHNVIRRCVQQTCASLPKESGKATAKIIFGDFR
ncbi:hypothetical protein [Flavilitoribacter nigricans]|uniref:Uncharacterized protein n=1 Tax=Flavilitoribacter nigricans (strain ATCC 23147 / DSM 23189 / NBRC 102662 / NCIMB 1420 / SS-2) TaxID=1122177 RepID=A0A2D0NEJ4_FLAN2|nr:hypothetical protein [Flavilitoribacter nigricans]PHN06203.1 hypothetical protein CRP01_11515 [Flavilitoribacter nigricans DSM 23189 = NBRC 102662]